MQQQRHHLIALAILSLAASTQAQAQAADNAPKAELERVTITGSMIKRTDRETPSVVQTISREDIKNSGFGTIEELLRSTGAVDLSSVGDGAASGFVSGLSTISLRGFGSQGTLTLINGRRIAPAAAVDVNFGRGNLVSVNTIPKGAIDRIEILKDGASAIYGSDAVVGVVNYVLRKDYQGAEAGVTYSANDKGVGGTKSANASFGFGDLSRDRFNVFGGLELSQRDRVMYPDLRDRGAPELYDQALNLNGSLGRFTPSSVASFWGNYYSLPSSTSGRTVIDGFSVANNSTSGKYFLGSLAGCPEDMTVGKGVPTRLPGFQAAGPGATDYGTASMPKGMCRYDADSETEAISKQDKIGATVRGTFAINSELTAYADVMLSKTTTESSIAPRTLTTSIFTSSTANTAVTWPKLDGTLQTFPTIVLPIGHPDNPTNGKAKPEAVQLIYRFADVPRFDTTELKAARFTAGLSGVIGDWDIDSALLYTRQDMSRVRSNELRASLLKSAIANHSYHFGKANDAAAIASVASDAVIDGKATIASVDVRASRELFSMAGGMAGVAVGGEFRRETLTASPNEAYSSGDFIGLVANGTSGARNSYAAFGELSLPVHKSLELQAALRAEKYSDFGRANTGKLGFKWSAMPSFVALRGTAATGFRAPSISQIGNSYASSFHSFGTYAVADNLRCNLSNPDKPVSKADPANSRDCNVLGFSARSPNPGSIATTISANPNLKPETSRSFTLGVILSPTKYVDLSLDAWYFQRDNEIRSQRGVDIMEDANKSPSTPNRQVIRDPNPATWLPGVPNSGPILMLVREYGNYNWTKTSGLDYELSARMPTESIGEFKLKIEGTYTGRYDYKILANGDTTYSVGTTTNDIPKTKATVSLNWKLGNWTSFARLNHVDKLKSSTTNTCLTSSSAYNSFLRANDYCYVSATNTVDIGGSYKGFKDMVLSFSVLNLEGTYPNTNGPVSPWTYYDSGSAGQLGRRFSVSASYTFK